jgi:lambda family phage minor tail protein L
MSTAPIITDLQKINPSAIIELFTLTTDATLHGSAQTYRFHNGTSLNANGDIIWAGNQYLKMPIQAEGFAFQKGQLPRPTLTISNALGTITAILLNVNQVTTGNDLTGATVTRIRTLARYLDAVNFPVTTTSTTTTTTIADPADAESVTYTVTVVQDSGGNNVFAINGVQKPVITMKRGSTYIFNQSHSSNVGHPLRITSDAGGQQTTTNAGTLGTDATVTYQPAYPSAPNDLRYYCTSHGNNMGNTITMNDPNTTTQETTTTTQQQVNPLGTPDPTAEFPQEIYKIDRKSSENREVVQFELAAVFDLAGIRAPKRQCTRTEFPSIGTFIA